MLSAANGDASERPQKVKRSNVPTSYYHRTTSDKRMMLRSTLAPLLRATVLATGAEHCCVAVVDVDEVVSLIASTCLDTEAADLTINSSNSNNNSKIEEEISIVRTNINALALEIIQRGLPSSCLVHHQLSLTGTPLVTQDSSRLPSGAIIVWGGPSRIIDQVCPITTLQAMGETAMMLIEQHRTIVELEQGPASQKQVLASLAHDLRTPLTGVQLSLSLLQEYASYSEPGQQECLSTAIDCATVLEGVCNRLQEPPTKSSAKFVSTRSNDAVKSMYSQHIGKDSDHGQKVVRQEQVMMDKVSFPTSSVRRPLPLESQGKRALVIDDSTVVRKSLERALKRMGFDEVQLAENGKVGLHYLKDSSFDITLCDFLMPVLDGLDCVSQLRAWEKDHRPQLPQFVVGMSAHASKNDVQRGLAAGMNTFIEKPVYLQQLRALLEDTNAARKKSKTSHDFSAATREIDEDFAPMRSHHCVSNAASNDDEYYYYSPRVCLVAVEAESCADSITSIAAEHGWQCRIVRSGEEIVGLLKARNWGAVVLDETCIDVTSMQTFRRWEQKHRVHRQKNVFILSHRSPLDLVGSTMQQKRFKLSDNCCLEDFESRTSERCIEPFHSQNNFFPLGSNEISRGLGFERVFQARIDIDQISTLFKNLDQDVSTFKPTDIITT